MLIFPIALFSIFSLIHYLAYHLFVRIFLRTSRARFLLKSTLILNLTCLLGYIFSRYLITIPQPLYFLFSLSLGMGFALLLTLIFYVLTAPILLLPMKNKRREAIRKMLGYTGGFSLLGYGSAGVFEASLEPRIVKVPMALPRLKHDFRAVQLSDIHIGGLIEESYMRDLVERVNTLKADMVFLTGDITDTKIENIKKAVAYLGELKTTMGIYFVSGNHEFFHGIGDTIKYLRELGITVLENESQTIEGIANIAGVHDIFGRRLGVFEPDLPKALKYTDKNLPTILLAHQPKFVPEVIDKPVDLILAGHTHGGQIAPFNLLVKLDQKYICGLYEITPSMQLYVNPGTGFWGPPMRFLSRAEITLFEFKAEFKA